MSERWDFYFCRIEGALASIFVDLGLEESAPDASRPVLSWIRLEMNVPRPDGLSSEEESQRLFQIEEAIEELAESRGDQYIGRITSSGSRTFFVYGGSDAGFAEAAAAALAPWPDYRITVGKKRDPDWSSYLQTLLPSPEERQRMADRRVVDSLERHGDVLTTRRPIDHWLYFPRDRSLDAVLQALATAGFTLRESPRDEGDSRSNPVCVRVQREDAADLASINECTSFLFRLAREHGGEYDGWESPERKGGDV